MIHDVSLVNEKHSPSENKTKEIIPINNPRNLEESLWVRGRGSGPKLEETKFKNGA